MRHIIIIGFVVAQSFCLGAQSADSIDEILGAEQVSWGKIVRFSLAAAGLIDESESEETAIDFIRSRGWNTGEKDPDEQVNLGELSLLLMESFQIEGGILFTLTRSPRYAAREVVSRQWAKGGPFDPVSGMEFLTIIGNVSRAVENRDE